MTTRRGLCAQWGLLVGVLGAVMPLRAPADATPGTATFRVTTLSAGAKYAPRHVLAIWVTDSQTNFVKTLKRQAGSRIQYLYKWAAARASYTGVDGTTGATLTSHQAHTVTWDCRNTNGVVMSDGQYRFYVEFTEANAQGPWTATNWVGFTKGIAFVTSNIPNLANFTSMQIVYSPQVVPPTVHDVAVAAVNVLPLVQPGAVAAITVVATNLGNVAETFAVALSNETQGASLGTRTAGPLAAGAATNVTFLWNTAGGVPGSFRMRAFAGPVAGETNVANNTRAFGVVVATGLATNASIAAGAAWRYQDEGLALHETPWRERCYYDGAWPEGPAPIGFGNGGEATAIARTHAVAYYFRRSFTLPSVPISATARLVRDDGAVLYINGTEAWRDRMPVGVPSNTTWATGDLMGAAETTPVEVPLNADLLREGVNTLAAEIHQAAQTVTMLPWINEIHYDNPGTVINQGVEIAGPPNHDLSAMSIVLYNGTNGLAYATVPLTGMLDSEARNTAGAVWFPIPVMQNDSPDGLALVAGGSNVLQFLSYEGSFIAADGPAAGQHSTDISVFESATGSAGDLTLQLTGAGRAGRDFTWTGPLTQTRGTMNAGQSVPAAEVADLRFDLNLTTVTPQFGLVPASAIVAVGAPGEARVGDVMPVSITVSNSGTAGGTFRVMLMNTNSQETLGTQEIVWLEPGAVQTVTIAWPTFGSAPGSHSLQATVVVNGETSTAGSAAVGVVVRDGGGQAAEADAVGSLGGFCRAVAVQGELVVVAEGATLALIDASTSARLGSVRLPGRPEALALRGTLAAAACGADGVHLADISDPAHPALRGIIDTSGHATAVAFGNGLMAVADGRTGVRLFVVEDAAAPVLAGAIQTEGPARALAWDGSLLYVLDEHAGLRIIDAANPIQPVSVGALAAVAFGRGLVVAPPRAYVSDEFGWFRVLDVANPAMPIILGETPLAAAGGPVVLHGTMAYVALGAVGLQPVNVADAGAPIAGAVVTTEGAVHDLALTSADTLLAAEGPAGLGKLSLALPESPAPVSILAEGVRAADAATLGPLTLLACGEKGFRVYRIGQAADPELLAVSMLASNARAVAAAGNVAYVGDGEFGLKAFALTDPAAPALLGTYATTGLLAITRVAAHGTAVAVTDGERVEILNAANPSAITRHARYDGGHRVFDLAWLGSDLALAAGLDGVWLLNPDALTLSTFSTDTPAVAIDGADPHLYVATAGGGWLTLSATNRAALQQVLASGNQGTVYDVALAGGQVVLAGDRTVRTVDLSVPLVPLEIVAAASLSAPRRVVANTDILLAAEDDAGAGFYTTAGLDTDGDGLPDAWEQVIVNADPLDAITSITQIIPFADFDGDGLSNADEILAGTNPADGDSRLAIVTAQSGDLGVTLRWFSAAGRTYGIQRAWNLREGFTRVVSGLPATQPVNTYTTSPESRSPAYYRVVTE